MSVAEHAHVARALERELFGAILDGAEPEALIVRALRRLEEQLPPARFRAVWTRRAGGPRIVLGAESQGEREALAAWSSRVDAADPAPPAPSSPAMEGPRWAATAPLAGDEGEGLLIALHPEAAPASALRNALREHAPAMAIAVDAAARRRHLASLVEHMGQALVLIAPDRTVLAANRVARDRAIAAGRAPPRSGRDVRGILSEAHRKAFDRRLDDAFTGRTVVAERDVEVDGETLWFADELAPVPNEGGAVRAVAFTSWDVTDRRRAEAMLARRNRTLALLSATSRALVRAQSDHDLFERVCRAAVERAGFSLAWVGIPNERGVLRPVAKAGHAQSYLQGVTVSIRADDSFGSGPGGMAYRSGQVHVVHGMERETAHPSWSHVARVHGLASAATLPLIRAGRSIGVLCLYADDDPFDDAAVEVLETIARDLAHALDALSERRARRAAEIRLAHLNRALLLLSRSSFETVRAGDEDDLFERTCRVAVQEAGFRLAWVGAPDRHGELVPRAAQGEAMAYLDAVRIGVSSTEPEGSGPAGRAFRTGALHIVQDMEKDDGVRPWREAARAFGLASVASIPLVRNGATVAVLTVYDEHTTFFDDAVADVLRTLQGDLGYALDALAERKTRERVERQRHESEERFRRFVAASEDLIFTLDADGRYTGAYGAPLGRWNLREEDVLGRTVGEVLGDDVAAVHDDAFYRAAAGSGASYEWTTTDDGGTRAMQTRLSPLVGPSGRTLGVLGVGRDITELRDRETEARRLSSVVEQSPSMVVVTDLDGRTTYVNPVFSATTGFAPDEVVGRPSDLSGSGFLDDDGHQALWSKLLAGEVWRGEFRNRRKDGSLFWESATIAPVRDTQGRIQAFTKVSEDVSERRELRERVAYLSMHDRLTGLPNRALFLERLSHLLPFVHRHGRHAAVLAVDLDNFKLINETLGLDLGDRALVALARRLKGAIGSGDTAAHFGGDEFWLLLPDLPRPEAAGSVADDVLRALRAPLELEGRTLHPSASVGVALAADPLLGPHDLLHHADLALARAKGAEKGGYHYFEPKMNAHAVDRMMIENGIRRGLEEDQFRLVIQPRVRLADGVVVGNEALLRWQHPELGAVSPRRFVSVAEETGLIVPLGDHVLDEAIRLAASWKDDPCAPPLSVNLSAVQLRLPDLTERIAARLHEHGLPAERLRLEITETALMEDAVRSASVLGSLRDLGVRIEIDDFGTGYSSLNYLRLLPVDLVKIDRSFIADLGRNADAEAIVRSILGLANGLGLDVLAEGIETEGQLERLQAMGCTMGQGFLFAYPGDPAVRASSTT